MTTLPPEELAKIDRQVRLSFRCAQLDKENRELRARIRRVTDRLTAAENSAALAQDHLKNCMDNALEASLTEWDHTTGQTWPTDPSEAAEQALDAQR